MVPHVIALKAKHAAITPESRERSIGESCCRRP
jgi:hypothetical protein